jgi:CysZ protein
VAVDPAVPAAAPPLSTLVAEAPAPADPAGLGVLGGAACLLRGLGFFLSSPSLWLIGLLPALLALVVLGVLLAGVAVALPAVVGALTPFARGWPAADRDALQLVIGLVLAVSALWLAIMSFTALTLTIGQPFYEAIAGRIEARDGGRPPEVQIPWWRATGRAARDGLLMVALTGGLSLGHFLLALVPLLGQTLVPLLGAGVAAWLLTVELTSVAFERRGFGLPNRLRLLWRHRAVALGFGGTVLLLFLLPFGAIIVMPGAVAGGSLLARRLVS